ncbi:MAG: hypothetical protein MPL62_04410, partial [Alphaproteobacteria bacterium]|nr:hypothetical protein [Alphaproteobacteria bacterium]
VRDPPPRDKGPARGRERGQGKGDRSRGPRDRLSAHAPPVQDGARSLKIGMICSVLHGPKIHAFWHV